MACWLGEIRPFPVSVCTVTVTDYNRLHRPPRHRTSRRMEVDVPPRVVSTPRVPTNHPSASSGSTPPTARRDAHTQSSIYFVVSLTQVALTPSPRGSVLDVALRPPRRLFGSLPLRQSPLREHACAADRARWRPLPAMFLAPGLPHPVSCGLRGLPERIRDRHLLLLLRQAMHAKVRCSGLV